ncbi:MAG: Ig-like domain-containing protein, partial [Mobilitalea sp.]
SIYAEDVNGNKSIYKLVVDNFSDSLLGTPSIVTYTNRKTKISGRAEPNATIIFEAYTGTFQTTVSKTGTYSYALPAQPSGSEIIVYAKDKVKGIESEHVSVLVKRTGPNQPSINPVLNNAGYITGDANDDDASVIAISGETVYVSDQGGKALYEANTEIYNPALEIVETYVGVNEEGFYLILMPPREAGSEINVYNLDHLSRNSRVATATTVDAGPNAPIVYEVSNIENTIRGYVPSKKNEIFDIKVVVNHKTYSLETNKYGVFSCEIEEQLHVGDSIVVMSYESSNSAHMSYPVEVIVKDIEDYVKDTSVVLEINDLSDKSNIISGTYEADSSVLVAITKGSGDSFASTTYVLETDGDGAFEYSLDNKLTAGMKVYVMTRFMDGNILYARRAAVRLGKPDTPILVHEVTNADKSVKVRTTKDCTVTLTIGSNQYKTSEYVYEKSSGKYIYTLAIARGYSGAKITVSAVNTTSASDLLTSEVVKTAPDQPMVNAIKAGDTEITGTVELLDYEISEEKAAAYEHLFVDAAPKVASTMTRIYVQIGTKKYKGTINNSGKFSITVPALKAGKIVQVWGSNKAGRGPLNNVTVDK